DGCPPGSLVYAEIKRCTVYVTFTGYPDYKSLVNWYREYNELGYLRTSRHSWNKYTDEEKQRAVNYYNEHGKCVLRTVKALGYPSRPLLCSWLKEMCPDYKTRCSADTSLVNLPIEEKMQAVIELHTSSDSVNKIAHKYGVTSTTLRNWDRQLSNEEPTMPKRKIKSMISNAVTSSNTEELTEEVERLRKLTSELQAQANELADQVYHLQLEKDVLEKAAEIIKKDKGVSLDTLTNREKAIVIGALRDKYPLKELLLVFNMAKSSFCYQTASINATDKYKELREAIRTAFNDSGEAYGYRRIHKAIKNGGTAVSEKVIRRLMSEEGLAVRRQRRKRYNSYQGEMTPAVPNLLQRDFHADSPNKKWLTDITEFSIPAGKIYLSPIIDCFDGLPVSWTIGTSPNADLANTMLDMAISTLKEGEYPIVHSNRGAHYRWPGWIQRMNNAGLTRSMSKKGCSPDNSACEGFFGRLKNEMFYGRDWKGVSIDQFIHKLDRYIKWYAEKRIKLSLNGMSPIDYRRSLGLID
ncbi:MAG: IS3 family transposase, partial [Parasporobacterium sp.]|nr:IS3 family transposase [Parasporobacterium sp.]